MVFAIQRAELFMSYFPCLMKLSFESTSFGGKWQKQEIDALLLAVREGRMPRLEDLTLSCGSMQGWGKQLAQIMSESKTLKRMKLDNTDLSTADGQEIIRAIEDDSVQPIEMISLRNCPNISRLSENLQIACKPRNIELRITKPKKPGGNILALIPQLTRSLSFEQTQHQSNEPSGEFSESNQLNPATLISSFLQFLQPFAAQTSDQMSPSTTDKGVPQNKKPERQFSLD